MPHLSKEQRRKRASEHKAWWEAATNVPYGFCMCGCGERTPLAPYSGAERHWVKGEPRPYVDSIHGNRFTRDSHLNRFRVEDRGFVTPCWIWTGNVYSTGYGRLKYKGRAYSAHRFFYESEHGPPPSGTQLHHLCENTLCVRVSHLQPLSPASHVHLRSTTKLTASQARKIRELHSTGDYTHLVLANQFGVERSLVSQIIRNEIWINE